MQCDFCSNRGPLQCYRCRSFESDSRNIGVSLEGWTIGLQSLNEWYACSECCSLIDSMDIGGLVDRVTGIHFAGRTESPAAKAFRAHISYTYQLFFTNRIHAR